MGTGSRVTQTVYGFLLASSLVMAESTPTFASEVHRFDVPAEDAAKAIEAFGVQTGVQILAAGEGLQSKKLNAVKGVMSVDDGLNRLLVGTGFSFRYVGDHAVALVAAAGQQSDTPAPATKPAAAPTTTSSAPVTSVPQQAPPPSPAGYNLLEEIVVTGTYIRGVAPVGAEVLSFNRDDIEKSGAATVQDLFRTLPMNFEGGVNETIVNSTLDRQTQNNVTKASGLNLRGLGAGSTLVLLNGRRLAPGGLGGGFVDISMLPLTALDRVEVLPDGASALYGSDAVGGVVNFATRKNFSGAETQGRFGQATGGDARTYQFGQILGTSWDSGNALLAVQGMRREGLPATDRALMNSDLRPFGGSNFDVNTSNPGTIQVGAQTWAIPPGQNGVGLTSGMLTPGTQNLTNRNLGVDLLSDSKQWSALGTVEQKVTDSLNLFADGLFSDRKFATLMPSRRPVSVPRTNPFYVNPTGATTPVTVNYDFTDDLGELPNSGEVKTSNIALGATYDIGAAWEITGYLAYARQQDNDNNTIENLTAINAALASTDPATALNVFGDGSNTNPATLANLVNSRIDQIRSEDANIKTANVLGEGPIAHLPAGDLRLAIGSEYRREALKSYISTQPATLPQPNVSRDISAGFAELFVPIFGPDNRHTLLERLDFSAAGRYEHYNDFGSSTVPKIGFAWAPIRSVTILGSWTKSFKAPNLTDLAEVSSTSSITQLPDPASPTQRSNVLLLGGSNPNLKPETARIWSGGLRFAPPAIPKLSLEWTYFNIDYTNRIGTPGAGTSLLSDPRYASFIIRNPTAAERQQVCAETIYLAVGAADCVNTPVGALVDAREQNAAKLRETGLDFLESYSFDTSVGEFGSSVYATYLFKFQQALTANAPLLDLLSTQENPINFRARGSLSWSRWGFGVTGFVNYQNSYRDTISVPSRRIASWTTVDLNLAYSFENSRVRWLQGTKLFLNAQNLFDRDPPFYNNASGFGYDPENANLLERVVAFSFRADF